MKIVYGNIESEVSTMKVSADKLVEQPAIVELVSDHQTICEQCPVFAETNGNCAKFPFCQFIQAKQWTVPKYPTGVVETEKGEVTVFQEGQPAPTYARKYYVVKQEPTGEATLRLVEKSEMKGYEVVEKGGKIGIEERQPFQSSTSTLEITPEDLYPSGVVSNFLVEGTYEVYAKSLKKEDDSVRNIRKLYEIAKDMAQQNKIAIKTGFVWKKGTYNSWAVIIEPILFDDGRFILTMKTTGANLKWTHPMTVPKEVKPIPESQAPTVNNLKALGSFLEGIKQKTAPNTA